MLDPNNPIVKYCVAGMRLEGEGKYQEACRLFTQAWEAHRDDFEACIAAHFLARCQGDPQERLHWNQESLARAEAVGDERVRDFYPSLYLNLGYSHEQLGNAAEARRFYDLAAGMLGSLPGDRYGEIVRKGIEAARTRVDDPGG